MKHVLHCICSVCLMFLSIRLEDAILIVRRTKWTKFGRTAIVTKAFGCRARRHKGSLEGVRSGPGFVCWSCTASKPAWERFCIGIMLQAHCIIYCDIITGSVSSRQDSRSTKLNTVLAIRLVTPGQSWWWWWGHWWWRRRRRWRWW